MNYAHAIKIEALAQLGGLLNEMPKQNGARGHAGPGRGNGVPLSNPVFDVPKLSDLGISKKTSMIAQQLAALPDDTRTEIANREQTLKQALNKVRRERRIDKIIESTKPSACSITLPQLTSIPSPLPYSFSVYASRSCRLILRPRTCASL